MTAADILVRSAFFNQNFSESFMADSIPAGVVALPVNGAREPFVDVDDIAEIVAQSVTEDRHVGQIYEVTGPELLAFGEAVAQIAHATDRSVTFVPMSVEEYTDAARAQGVPDEIIEVVAELFPHITDGRNEYLSDGVEQALGRAPRRFADYARDAAAAGAWG